MEENTQTNQETEIEREYFYPTKGITVTATSQAEANQKADVAFEEKNKINNNN